MTPAKNRRWFRWSLRTMFLVVAMVCLALGYEWRWIDQRRRALEAGQVEVFLVDQLSTPSADLAPGMLGLFGELGYPVLFFKTSDQEHRLTHSENAELHRLQRLFPEAEFGFSWTPPAPPKYKLPPIPANSSNGSSYDGFQL